MAALAVKDAVRTSTPITNIDLKTYDDLLAMPDDGNRYELIFGEIVMSPAPTEKHQFALGELFKLFSNHALKHGLGLVLFAPYDVRLSIHNVVEPDLLYIKREHTQYRKGKYLDGAPDLIVEVLSPSNRAQDVVRKAALYTQFEVPEYWIVDPEAETIAVNELREGQYVHVPNRRGIARSAVIPGLKVRVAAVFAMPGWMTAPPAEQH
jgi:Uma2 family endonuclease